jgi:hypothetical protein
MKAIYRNKKSGDIFAIETDPSSLCFPPSVGTGRRGKGNSYMAVVSLQDENYFAWPNEAKLCEINDVMKDRILLFLINLYFSLAVRKSHV